MGGEFAKEFPKIAARLGMEGFECADPYVERLLEGFAFLAAIVPTSSQFVIDCYVRTNARHTLSVVEDSAFTIKY